MAAVPATGPWLVLSVPASAFSVEKQSPPSGPAARAGPACCGMDSQSGAGLRSRDVILKETAMRRFLRDNGLSITLGLLFLASLAGMILAGWHQDMHEALRNGASELLAVAV